MRTGQQLVEALDSAPPVRVLAQSGVSELDELTGGLQQGQIWVITGHPSEGKTTLLYQLASAVARNDHSTLLVSPRESTASTARRLLAHLSRGPMPVPGSPAHRHEIDPTGRLEAARGLLRDLPVGVFASDTAAFTPETDASENTSAAVFVDDADLLAGMTPQRAAAYAEADRLVVVALPRQAVLEGGGTRAPLRPGWTRPSDVVIEVRSRSLRADRGAAGLVPRPPHLRPGEADLIIHRNRWGVSRTLAVRAFFHLARFLDPAGADS